MRCCAHAEIQPTKAAPDTDRACLLSAGHAGLHMSGISAAPNDLQLLGEADARKKGIQITLPAIPCLAHLDQHGCGQCSSSTSDGSRASL